MSSVYTIENVRARKIFDSRGNDAIEVDVSTRGGFGRFSSPSGASTGRWEVQAYPEGGVDEAVKIINEQIKPEIIGISVENQENIDSLLHEIDGTDRFSKIGGNVALAISISSALAAAYSKRIPLFQYLSGFPSKELPLPLGNVLGGGMHARGDRTDIQEFLILPLEAKSFGDAANANVKVHQKLVNILDKKGIKLSGKGDEGAWIAGLETLKALEALDEACREVEKELDMKIGIGLDIAASTLWDINEECYVYKKDGNKFDVREQVDFVLSLIKEFNLVYIEDPVQEEDFESLAELTKKAGKVLICGDDSFTTNIKRLDLGSKLGAGNAIIIKPNQVGTLTDTYKTVKGAKSLGYTTITSHRSGETCEPLIAHLAVAFNSPIVKIGVIGGERVLKINELIRIEEMLGKNAKLAEVTQ